MKRLLFCLLLLFTSIPSFTQLIFNGDFSWATQDSEFVSMNNFTLCEGLPTVMTLTTSLPHRRNINPQGNPLSNGHPSTSVLIPYPNMVMPLMVTVTLTFSQPVANLRLLIRDLDDDTPSPGPEETLSNFRINGTPTMASNIIATSGSYQVLGMVTNPLAANCNGWFTWPLNNISSLSFDYDRDIMNYAILLDSIQFECNESFVAIEEPENAGFDLVVSPSPVSSALTIKVRNEDKNAGEVWISNFFGQCLAKVSMNSAEMSLDVSQLPSGLYFISLVNEGKKLSQRFVVQH